MPRARQDVCPSSSFCVQKIHHSHNNNYIIDDIDLNTYSCTLLTDMYTPSTNKGLRDYYPTNFLGTGACPPGMFCAAPTSG